MLDIKEELSKLIIKWFFIFNIIFIVLFVFLIYNIIIRNEIKIGDYIIPIVTLVTSIVIGSFFFNKNIC